MRTATISNWPGTSVSGLVGSVLTLLVALFIAFGLRIAARRKAS